MTTTALAFGDLTPEVHCVSTPSSAASSDTGFNELCKTVEAQRLERANKKRRRPAGVARRFPSASRAKEPPAEESGGSLRPGLSADGNCCAGLQGRSL